MQKHDDWPPHPDPEVDGYTYELGPSDDDRRWAADALNGDDWHDQDAVVPDDVLNRQAEESEAQDLLDRGLLPL